MANPLDEAITSAIHLDISRFLKTEEIPYDSVRKRLSVVVRETGAAGASQGEPLMITKGALDNILAACTAIEEEGTVMPLDGERLPTR